MAISENGAVNSIGQASSEPDTYQQIRDDLDTLMAGIKNVECGLTFSVIRETETRGDSLDKDFVATLYCFRDLIETLYEHGDAMVSRMMLLEREAEQASAGRAVLS